MAAKPRPARPKAPAKRGTESDARLAYLRDRRAALVEELAQINRELDGLAGRNPKSLADLLAELLDGRTMSVAEATEAALRAGHRSRSKNFRFMVNVTLAESGRFKRTGWGRYTTNR